MKRGDGIGAGLAQETERQVCEESRLWADRLLIKPVAVDQAGTDASARTDRGNDTP
jgi:hypothetical protein